MSQTRTHRGRPKGSGIDDRQKLDAIARLIAENPALKPTTAIRSLGVSDPSVIRRLRDKFNAVRADLIHDIERAVAGAPPAAASRTKATATRSRPHTSQQVPAATVRAQSSNETRVANDTRVERARSIAAASQTSSTRTSAVADAAALPATAAVQPPLSRPAARAAATPSKPRAHAGDDDSERLQVRSAMSSEAIEMFTKFFSAGVAATNTLMAAHTTMANEFIRSPYMSLALRQQLAFSEWAVGLVPSFQNPNKTAT